MSNTNDELAQYDRRRSDVRIDTLEARIKALDLTMRLKFEHLSESLSALHETLLNINHDRRVPWQIVLLIILGILLGDIAIIYTLLRWGGFP